MFEKYEEILVDFLFYIKSWEILVLASLLVVNSCLFPMFFSYLTK